MNNKFYVEVDAYKKKCIDMGIFPVCCKNALEELKTDNIRENIKTNLISSYNPKEPNKPYACAKCGKTYTDYIGINFCSGCGSEVENVIYD